MPHPNVEVRPSRGPKNALWYCFRDVSRWRVFYNWIWMTLARNSPWFTLKNFLLRRTGATIGKHVSIGYACQFDVLFPRRIRIDDDAIVGYNTTLLAHGYTQKEYQLGNIHIEKGASVGANCTVLPGVTVGAGAVIGAMSLVNRDVPAGEFWAGVPARRIRDRY